jgi:tRNA threonylcarbamoyladenosine biosynthesis protein TsaB
LIALALDSATDLLSVALAAEDGIYYMEIDAGLRHSERLMELADSLLSAARLSPSAIGLVACMRGPGSFTGLRIGMAAAKGISASLDIPLLAEPTLDCIAAPHEAWPGFVVPIIDAKKGRWFSAVYDGGKRLTDYLDAEAGELAAALGGDRPVLVTGADAPRGAEVLASYIVPTRLRLDPAYRRGTARELLAAAIERYMRIGSGDGDSIGPEYLRKSEAELAREATTFALLAGGSI